MNTNPYIAFLAHSIKCACCRRFPYDPCAHGLKLFERGAKQLTERMLVVQLMRN